MRSAACAAASDCLPTAPPPTSSHPLWSWATPPAYTHVICVCMENHSYNTIIGSSRAPYINSLATKCGLATNYHNVSHPSLPNYVSATSGLGYRAIAKFDGDCNPVPGCVTSAATIFGQAATWKTAGEAI